jgi:DinB superfamily
VKKALLIPALLLLAASPLAQTLTAQTLIAQTTTAPAAAAPTPVPPLIRNPISNALRETLPNRLKNTIAAVEAMPAEKFNFKPTPDQMPFGHLVAHMIDTNYLLCSGATAVPAPKIEAVTETDPKDKLVAALKASFDFCSDALAKMDDARLGETTSGPNGQQLSRARFALGIASNWADHYAEAAMYLRSNGILPPTAKK